MKFLYEIEQLKNTPEGRKALFMSFEQTQRDGGVFHRNYEVVARGGIEAGSRQEAAEKLFRKYNLEIPADYTGRSLSVSDIVTLIDPKETSSWFCDNLGFVKIKEFADEQN